MKVSYVVKFIAANLIAAVVASLFMDLYVGRHRFGIKSNGSSNRRNEPNFYLICASEGFFCGRFDANGYNNKEAPDVVDVLLLGSSHFEALQVMQSDNVGNVLKTRLESGGDSWGVYNLGSSGNCFPYVVSHFDVALQTYNPKKYVAVECCPSDFTSDLLEKALDGSLNKRDSQKLKPSFLQRLFAKFRIFDYLLERFAIRNAAPKKKGSDENDDMKRLTADMKLCLRALSESAKKNNVKCIVLFRPSLTLNKDGSMSSASDGNVVQTIKELSESEGLIFLDLTDRFLAEFEAQKRTPYGFWNTIPNSGHCNKEGHRMMAEALYDKIMELENSKEEETR